MRMYQRGIITCSQPVLKGKPGAIRPDGTSISVDMDGSDPVNTKRRKPAPVDLIWSGQPYSKWRSSAVHQQFTYEHDVSGKSDWYTSWFRYWGASSSLCSDQPVEVSAVDPMNQLLNKLRNDVANVATMLGEYKDTCNLFADAGEKILRSVKHAKKGRITQALRSLGEAVPYRRWTRNGKRIQGVDYPTAWLQYKLALMPLLDDVQNLVDELTSDIKDEPALPIKKVTKSSRAWFHSHKETSRNRWAEVSVEHGRKLIAYVQIDNIQLKNLSDHGLTNPAALLWELAWLSFVVDYVYNVSEWLQALDQPYQFTRSVCYETQRLGRAVRAYAVGDGGLGTPGDYPVRLTSPCQSVYNYKSTARTLRTLSAVQPQWNPSGGLARLATLSSLAVVIGRKAIK